MPIRDSSDGTRPRSCNKDHKPSEKTPEYGVDGKTPLPDAVDLGEMTDSKGIKHHVQWASCNLGAFKEDESGDHYAWGETWTKDNYSNDSYSYKDTPYWLLGDKDVASKKLGNDWRIPTEDEWDALLQTQYDKDNYTWTKVSAGKDEYGDDLIKAWRITSKKEGTKGNSILIPLAGAREGTQFIPNYSLYWSASLYPSSKDNAYAMYFSSEGLYTAHFMRYRGFTIRPVRGGPVPIDFGLMVNGKKIMFASCNLEASEATASGGLYAWGESVSKIDLTDVPPSDKIYTWSNYAHCNPQFKLIKYCQNTPYNKNNYWGVEGKDPDGLTVLQPEDDAAHVLLGSRWRMSTKEEFEALGALRNDPDFKWDTYVNPESVLKITQLSTGINLFFPRKRGYIDEDNIHWNAWGYYWSSSLSDNRPDQAYYIEICDLMKGESFIDKPRSNGMAIRPVWVE